MKATRLHLDANVILRFLRDDDPQQSPAAARLFADAKAGRVTLRLSDVTLAEVFYVLARVYRLGNGPTAETLLPLVQSDLIDVEFRHRAMDTLRRVAETKIDFGDAYLAASASEAGEAVASFDHDLRAFKDVNTVVPR